MKLPIPVSVITGGLGSGKTTAICDLIAKKSVEAPEERWAVLVNEFGALGIDGALLEGASASAKGAGGVVVRELAGGCLCCTLAGGLGVSIAQLVRNVKPDRLLIEPSGLGHPAGLVDTLQNEHLRSALLVQAIVCLVDVRMVDETGFLSNQAFQDQINMADIVVGNKMDVASEAQVEAFHSFVSQLYPPKSQAITTAHGQIGLAVLSAAREPVFTPMFAGAHASRRRRGPPPQLSPSMPATATAAAAAVTPSAAPMPAAPASTGPSGTGGRSAFLERGQQHAPDSSSGVAAALTTSTSSPTSASAAAVPRVDSSGDEHADSDAAPDAAVRMPEAQRAWDEGRPACVVSDASPDHIACGWLFSASAGFCRDPLLALLGALLREPAVARVKGVFRIGKDWQCLQIGDGGAAVLQPIAYRKDSRMEVIVTRSWPRSEAQAGVPAAVSPPQEALGGQSWVASVVQAVATQQWDVAERGIVANLLVT